MDLAKLVNATKPVTATFLGETINLEVYKVGYQRLTAEQMSPLRDLFAQETDIAAVQAARLALPLLIKSWDVEWDGQPLPISEINDANEDGSRKYELPDTLLIAIEEAVREATADPSKASESPNSLAQEENVQTLTAAQ